MRGARASVMLGCMTDQRNAVVKPADAARWDAHYSREGRIWSGAPNHALVAEVSGMEPGRVLDIGCGEGADSTWLAARGWRVTGLDPSGVALERARAAASDASVDVEWVQGGLQDASLERGAFDLVVAMYAPLREADDPVPGLLELVAPGGTLLVVHHADFAPKLAEGETPVAYVMPEEIAEVLRGRPEEWTLEVAERRAREVSGGAGAHHRDDVVVRARRA